MPYLNRRVDLKRFGALSLLPPLLFAQTEVSTGFLRKHPAFYLHCHPGLVNMRGRGQYEGCQAFTKTTSDMRARGLTAAFFSRVADASILKRDTTWEWFSREAFRPEKLGPILRSN